MAKRLVVFAQRQGGQSQFSPHLALAPADPEHRLARVQAHVLATHLRDSLAVAELAAIAGMSTRHFAREFSEWADMTPHEFVERARLDSARGCSRRHGSR